MSDLIGKALGHYHVLGRLGEGGMGIVYRARDQHLERDVAIKVLPHGSVANEAARLQFREEALALSRLNHPGIATIHDFDHQNGMDFLVMEMIEGQPLSERLSGAPFVEPELLRIGLQIVEALDLAHELGVTHRDLKPANVMLTPRGQVKVLDFGLAGLRAEALSRLTVRSRATATIGLGTLAYMAPEQLIGNPPDGRADLYSLGVLLYELGTRRRPFESDLQTALVYQITNQAPPPPGRFRPDLSRRLEDVILKCLEKDPGDRYQSARELGVDLRRLLDPARTAAAAPRRIASIAVLPLENLSGDPEQEFFADGMTDALIADLAQIESLRVISRTSMMRYKGVRRPLRDIARELDVEAIVEGSVVRAGERVRITAQLIDARADRHLWARSYQRDVRDVLELQGEVAREIAAEIRLELTPRDEARLATPRRVDPVAHDACLRGRFLWNQRTPEALERALQCFRQSLAADPGYAAAYAGIADTYNILGIQNLVPGDDAFVKARAAARKALELDPAHAEALASLAFVEFNHDWDWRTPYETFGRALASNPGYATARQWLSQMLVAEGRFAEGLAEAKRALALDPLSPIIHSAVSDAHFYAGDYEASVRALEYGLELDTRFSILRQDMARAFWHRGERERATALWEQVVAEMGSDPATSPILAQAYAGVGRTSEATAILGRLMDERRGRFVSPWAIAVIHWHLGDRERTLEWLERGVEERDRAMVWLRAHPRYEPVRGEPRFAALVERLGFPGR